MRDTSERYGGMAIALHRLMALVIFHRGFYFLIATVVLHAGAALKHLFVNRDWRMLGISLSGGQANK